NLKIASDLCLSGGVEKHLRAKDVGADERAGIVDAAINVTFCGEVDDGVYVFGGVTNGIAVGDAAVNEAVARVSFQVTQVGQVARIGQAVEVDNDDVWPRLEQIANEIAADEAATARHHYRHHEATSGETAWGAQPGRTTRPGAGPGP